MEFETNSINGPVSVFVEAARGFRITLSNKFPSLDVDRELEQIRSLSILDDVFAAILRAQSPDEVQSIIPTAVKSQ